MASVVAGANHTDDVGSQLVLWRGSCSLLKEFSLLIVALTVAVFVYVFLLFQAIAHYLIRKPFFFSFCFCFVYLFKGTFPYVSHQLEIEERESVLFF